MNWFKRYLYSEIGIEFKACLYFCLVLFFYFLYQIIGGSLYASIITMFEMVLTAYIICYIQVYLLENFDEKEHLGIKEGIFSLGCSLLYTIVSILFGWYDRNIGASILFFVYMVLCYLCVFLVYRLKRAADTIRLNQELHGFKNRKEQK